MTAELITRPSGAGGIILSGNAPSKRHCDGLTIPIFRQRRTLPQGLIVWLLVTGNIAISFLNPSTGHENALALIAIAILAGASERLLPSLIRTFDESIKKNEQKS
jgi:hypothetical protein